MCCAFVHGDGQVGRAVGPFCGQGAGQSAVVKVSEGVRKRKRKEEKGRYVELESWGLGNGDEKDLKS